MSYLGNEFACGLDLGTTFSCIGVYRNGGVEIIPNTNAEKTTPSIVTILDEYKYLIGEEAVDHLVKNYDSTIFDVKRFIGKDFNDENIKEEIKLENYPFKIIKNGQNINEIEINKNNKIIKFPIEEITSLIIKKMVHSAENYLNKKINNLVITVPANFNDAQRKCTKLAAEIAGIEVIRIINEPTAAAIAYGFQEKGEEFDGNILIFDLGGGTFDVTILNINKDQNEEKLFNILSTNGNKFLGGVDFDEKLVEYVLKQFCNKNKLSQKEVKKDEKSIRKLKIACEKIKRDLSIYQKVTLSMENFYDNKNILEEISRYQFNDMCGDLLEKLEMPLERALQGAKITSDDISQIILVGGSSKLPMIKSFLQDYFGKSKINDSINPDESVAYGATLMAAKILLNNDNILSGFNLFDITPLSLGIEVKNKSKDEKIRKEGGIMSIIIPRGSKIPFTKIRNYTTAIGKQITANIMIYEGEEKYVKKNHILGKVILSGLPKKAKGKVMINVQFFIDVNGILTVTADQSNEKGERHSVEATIKNYMVGLTKEQISLLKEKNKKYIHFSKSTFDSSELRESLKDCEEGFNICENNEDKFNILKECNNILEKFIDSLDTNFDNEIMIEKYYLYIKDLFIFYSKTLNFQELIKNDKENQEIQENIIKNTLKHIKFFNNKSFGYLDNLMETIKDFPKKIFYKIVVDIIEELNNYGKEYIKDILNYSRYNSLIYFEKAKLYFDKYISKLIYLNEYDESLYNNCLIQIKTSQIYLNEINSGNILLCQDAIKHQKLIPSKKKDTLPNYIKNENDIEKKIEYEKNELILKNYEKMLENIKGKENIEEAICIANIIKININFLGINNNLESYFELGKRCEMISNKLKIEPTTPWYEEFKNLYKCLKDLYESSS